MRVSIPRTLSACATDHVELAVRPEELRAVEGGAGGRDEREHGVDHGPFETGRVLGEGRVERGPVDPQEERSDQAEQVAAWVGSTVVCVPRHWREGREGYAQSGAAT